MLCPYCDAEIIEGADTCDDCDLPLVDLSLSPPRSRVEKALLKDRISSMPLRATLSVRPDTAVGMVLRLMVDNRVGCVVVKDNEQLLGIFTERDALLRLNVDAASLAQHPVSEFMTRTPQTIPSDAKLAFAVHHMAVGGYRHLPVVNDNGRVVGVLSVRDILRHITDKIAAGLV